jgi:AcrR family transcriptional regulator
MTGKPVAHMRRSVRRNYDSSSRRAAAELTRSAVISAAARIFRKHGYAGASMAAIARSAGVSLDTVYASVGRKPALFRLLLESAISGEDQAVAAEDRDYVRAIRAEPAAAGKLQVYAAALARIHPRLSPLLHVLQAAAPEDKELAALWKDISERRAGNMRLLAQDLLATGEVRPALTVDEVADVIWAMNSPEFYLLLVEQRGWSLEKFEKWLAEAWIRLLLE